MATSEVIVSTDFGCRLDPAWSLELVKPLEVDPSVMVVAGNYAADMDTIRSPAARAAYYCAGGYVPNLSPGFLPSNRSIAYRRSVWEELGGYPEDLTFYADDTVFALQIQRAGYKTVYAPKAVVYWSRHSTLRDYWKEAYAYWLGNGEAGIMAPRFGHFISSRYYKILAHLDAMYVATRGSVKFVKRALLNRDPLAAMCIPILRYGQTINIYKGYAKGLVEGNEKCKACRQRLTKQSKQI